MSGECERCGHHAVECQCAEMDALPAIPAEVGALVERLRNPWAQQDGIERGKLEGWACDLMREAADALAAKEGGAVATHRHKKRGSEYVLIGIGTIQAEKWRTRVINTETDEGPVYIDASVDMREVAIYRSVDDGSLWVRPREEFEDGRFETLASTGEREESCPTCNGTGHEARHSICRDCDDTPAEEAGKVEAEPVAWRCMGGRGWAYYTEYGAAHVHELHGAVQAEPVYSAATVAKLTEERDNAWAEAREHKRLKNELVLKAYPAMDERDDLVTRTNALEQEVADLKHDIERQIRASGELATENEELRAALDVAAQKFDAIRKILINHLDEPERSAFWTAVEAQRIARAALGEKGE